MFSAYLENPTNCFFEGQDSDENIILLLRAHIITNLSWIIPAALLAVLPYYLPKFILFAGFSLKGLPETFATAFLVVNYLLVLVIVFEGFLNWYFNVNIVTNKRIVDIDFHSILFKNVDLAPLSSVQEASGQVGGVLGIVFNFGDVFIQTAGARVSLDFHKVPNPTKVADIVMDVTGKK